MQPCLQGNLVTTDQRVETAKGPQHQQRELALLARRVNQPALTQSRHRGFARPQQLGDIALAKPHPMGGIQYRLGQDGRGVELYSSEVGRLGGHKERI